MELFILSLKSYMLSAVALAAALRYIEVVGLHPASVIAQYTLVSSNAAKSYVNAAEGSN